MICPLCEHRGSNVFNSRKLGKVIFRQRKCKNCGLTFCTEERVIGKILSDKYKSEIYKKRQINSIGDI